MSDKSQTLEFKPQTNSECEHKQALWDIQVRKIEKVCDHQIMRRNEKKLFVAHSQVLFVKKD